MNAPEASAARDRVRAWIVSSDLPKAAIAAKAKVDEKTVRQAASGDWNPTVNTLAKLEALLPAGWKPGDPIPRWDEAA